MFIGLRLSHFFFLTYICSYLIYHAYGKTDLSPPQVTIDFFQLALVNQTQFLLRGA